MEEKKKYLMELIEELNFPMLPDEVEKHLTGLSEEETDKLISAYESIRNHEDALKDLTGGVKPNEFKNIKKKFQKEVTLAEDEYDKELEEVQKEYDERLEEREKKGEDEIKEIVENTSKAFTEVANANEDLAYALKAMAAEKPSQ